MAVAELPDLETAETCDRLDEHQATNDDRRETMTFEFNRVDGGVVTQPQGDTPMIKFNFNGSPNPTKIALMLEETGLDYEAIPVDPRRGEQFSPDYLAINPNAKVPAIVDGDVTVFDSNAILLYLAEKTGRFLPPAGAANRAELLSWLMFVATGVGPFCGQAVHFRHFASEKVPYANKRYQFEANRHFKILDERLATRQYLVGDTYTIADMSFWSWSRMTPFIMGDDAWDRYPNVRRFHDEIAERPAAQRAATLKDRHPFKTEIDDETRRNMFRHLAA